MRAFHELFRALDATTRSSVQERHLVAYFEAAPPEDAAWAAHLLLGRKGRRAVNTRLLREWAAEESGHPLWLVEESYDAVGDLAETLALLLSNADERPEPPALAAFMSERVMALAELDEDAKRALVTRTWAELDEGERFLFHKLISGGFRVGVAKGIVAKALARVAGVDRATILHRLSGKWQPTPEAWRAIVAPSLSDACARPRCACGNAPARCAAATRAPAPAPEAAASSGDGMENEACRSTGRSMLRLIAGAGDASGLGS